MGITTSFGNTLVTSLLDLILVHGGEFGKVSLSKDDLRGSHGSPVRSWILSFALLHFLCQSDAETLSIHGSIKNRPDDNASRVSTLQEHERSSKVAAAEVRTFRMFCARYQLPTELCSCLSAAATNASCLGHHPLVAGRR